MALLPYKKPIYIHPIYIKINAVCKFFNKKSVQIVEADSHISD